MHCLIYSSRNYLKKFNGIIFIKEFNANLEIFGSALLFSCIRFQSLFNPRLYCFNEDLLSVLKNEKVDF